MDAGGAAVVVVVGVADANVAVVGCVRSVCGGSAAVAAVAVGQPVVCCNACAAGVQRWIGGAEESVGWPFVGKYAGHGRRRSVVADPS